MKRLEKVEIDKIKPYEKNPRLNDAAARYVAESIKQCGYVAPIIVDENYTILAGHTRFKALKLLSYKEVEVLIITDLSEAQKKKYRLLDNKVAEMSQWSPSLLEIELKELDFDGFDFGFFTYDEDLDELYEKIPKESTQTKKKYITCPHCNEEIEL